MPYKKYFITLGGKISQGIFDILSFEKNIENIVCQLHTYELPSIGPK
jgi:hypothetical protein